MVCRGFRGLGGFRVGLRGFRWVLGFRVLRPVSSLRVWV